MTSEAEGCGLRQGKHNSDKIEISKLKLYGKSSTVLFAEREFERRGMKEMDLGISNIAQI